MKISYLIFFGFLFILLLFSLTTYINFRQTEEVNANEAYVTTSTTVVRQANRFQRNILNIISGLRGYLLTGEQSFIQAYDSASTENAAILKELEPLVNSNPNQLRSLNQLRFLYDKWIKEYAIPLRNSKDRARAQESTVEEINDLYKKKYLGTEEGTVNHSMQLALRTFINDEYALREKRQQSLTESIKNTRKLSFIITIFSIFIGFVIAALLAFSISSRIMKMVRMANSIAEGNYNVHMVDTRRDELGRLATALNHMAHVLDENFTLIKKKNEELDQFAHIVSHDLKAPFRGIDNVVSWIEEDHQQELSPKVHEYLQLIKGRLTRTENLISGILSYARVGKDEQDKEIVNTKELVNDVVDTLSLKDGVQIDVADDMPVLFTQRVPLFQVFSNLINNAVKYHDKKNGWVRVYAEEKPDEFIFYVADNGPGIASNYHNKIFQIFQTLQARDSFESTGVGLAIVKKILDERKEQIKIDSQPGKGSTFSFTWSKTD